MTAIKQARGIMAALSVLQGDLATGTLQVHSTGATGSVPAHSHGVPIVDGALVEDALVRVDKNPARVDCSWPVELAGTTVSVSAVQGGTRGNLDAGTEILWDPPLEGVETNSETVAGLSGGTWLETFGALKQIKEFRSLTAETALELFRAQVVDTPAAVLTWTRATPVSGSVSAAYGATQERAGRGRRMFKNYWALFLVCSRMSDSAIRLREGATLRDAVMKVLTDTEAVRGQIISSPQGIEILDARAFATTPTSFVDVISFATGYGLVHHDEQTFPLWLTTRLRAFFDADTHPHDIDAPDITFPMP